MPRSALIIDDSRVALAALGRLLREYGIHADTVESGPEALNHLRHNALPGVIFLDHMMPGMDGFETLRAFKQDARTSTIPVVMYTSKEDDAYMGQALAQGAIGVLHKPVSAPQLARILAHIDRLRRQQTGSEERRATTEPVSWAPDAAGIASAPASRAAVTAVLTVPPELRAVAVTATPDMALPEPDVEAPDSGGKSAPRQWWWISWALLFLCLLFPGVWYYLRYQAVENERLRLAQEVDTLRAEQAVARLVVPEPPPVAPVVREPVPRAWPETLAWALNQHNQYGYSDEPLGDARLAQLRELLERLAAAGFRGELRIETHVGEFCLTRDDQGALRLAGDELAFNRCEIQSQPPALAEQRGLRQSAAFARFLAEHGRVARDIRVMVVSHGADRPLVPYPDPAGLRTAGEWNRVARLNQRVEIVLVPGS
jgi:CheY-like chemotaxis protein